MNTVTDQRNMDPTAATIVENFSRILGFPDDEGVQLGDSLLDMGADSLALMKCIDFLQDSLGVCVSMTQFYQDFSTLGDIVDHVRGALARTPRPQPATAVMAVPSASPAPVQQAAGSTRAWQPVQATPVQVVPAAVTMPAQASSDTEWVRGLLMSHVALMDRQLQLLDKLGQRSSGTEQNLPVPLALPATMDTATPAAPAVPAAAATAPQTPAPADEDAPVDRFNVFASRANTGQRGLTETQSRYLAGFIDAYSARHARSKALTQQARKTLSDNRASAGFKPATKEILFPILADRAEGAHLWDVDGNRFVDITMGFGVHFFGHNPPFIRDPLVAQTQRGYPIGPQSPLAGRVAELVCELTGHERVVFCNSGSEATMTAMRIARAHTGRQKIVIFRESYHGTFDGFLARTDASKAAQGASVPVSAGVTPGAIADTLVLAYGEDEALAQVEALGPQLAAVLVEPVQSRRPWLQPREFLARLREITRKHGVVFIWDEVITGFRIAPGGAQEHFGIRADLATYGKIAGGGMPIGLVAGNATLLDLIDGGYWRYGDDSVPQSDQIFFAGTFTKHPLAMAAARAALEKIQAEQATLYPQLNERTRLLAEASNRLFEGAGIPVRVECFGSLFRYVSRKNIDMFFNHLMMEGVFIWEGRNCFLSTAHSDADIQHILQATSNAIARMQEGGFFDGKAACAPVTSAPITSAQLTSVPVTAWASRFTRLWRGDSALALNIGGGILFRGLAGGAQGGAQLGTPIAALKAAVRTVLGGSPALNVRLDASQAQWIASGQPFHVADGVGTAQPGETTEDLAARLVDAELARAFGPTDGAQVRATLASLGGTDALLILVANHAVCDGYSFALAVDAILAQAKQPATVNPLPTPLDSTAQAQARYLQSPACERDRAYWAGQVEACYAGTAFAPADAPGGPARRLRFSVAAAAVARLAKAHRATSFATLVTAFQFALWDNPALRARGVLGVPCANRAVLQSDLQIAQVSNLLPLPLRQHTDTLDPGRGIAQTGAALRDLATHGAYPLLAQPQGPAGMPGLPGVPGVPPIVLSVNLEPSAFDLSSSGFDAVPLFGKRPCVEFPIEVNMVRQGAQYIVLCDYQERTTLEPNVLLLMSRFEQLITTWSQNAD